MPDTATAPPPAAPAAPPPASAPSAPPAAAPKASRPPSAAAFDDLDALDKGEPLPSGAKPPGTTPEPDPEPSVDPTPKATDPAPKAATTPPAATTEPPPSGPGSIRELRTAYETAKAERAALRAELETLKKSTPKDDPEKTLFREQLDAQRKRADALEEELRYANYEKHPEYADKYQKPIQKIYATLSNEIGEYVVANGDGTERQATMADVNRILQEPSSVGANRIARELFGENSHEIMSYRRQLVDLSRQSQEARDEWKAKGGERAKAEQAQTSQKMQVVAKTFETYIKDSESKYPQFYSDDPADAEGQKFLTNGRNMAALAFRTLSFKGDGTTPPEELAKVHAEVFQRAASFGRLAYRNAQQKLRIEALEKDLAAYKASEPGAGAASGQAAGGKKTPTFAEEIDRLDKLNR